MRIEPSSSFKKDYKKHGFSMGLTENWIEVMYCLLRNLSLAEKFRDHQLTGNMKEYRECHIKPDLLLVYYIDENLLRLVRLESHSNIF